MVWLVNKFVYIQPFLCFFANIFVCDLRFFNVTTHLSYLCCHKFVYKSIIMKKNNCYVTNVTFFVYYSISHNWNNYLLTGDTGKFWDRGTLDHSKELQLLDKGTYLRFRGILCNVVDILKGLFRLSFLN